MRVYRGCAAALVGFGTRLMAAVAPGFKAPTGWKSSPASMTAPVKVRSLVGLDRPPLGEPARTVGSGRRKHRNQRHRDPGQGSAAHGAEHEIVDRADEQNVEQHQAGG